MIDLQHILLPLPHKQMHNHLWLCGQFQANRCYQKYTQYIFEPLSIFQIFCFVQIHSHVFSNITKIGKRRAVPYTMPEDGFIQSISMYHNGGSGKMLLGLYADNGQGYPGSRLGVTAETDVSSIEGWQSIELKTPVYVPAGTPIWLAWVYENNPGIRYQTGMPGRAESNETWSGGMPISYGPSSIANYIYSIYATYNRIH